MALIQAANYKSIELPEAYFRVVKPQINLSKDAMWFQVWVYPSAEAAKNGANLLDDLTVTYNHVPYALDGGNPLAQAYGWLKQQAAFADAVDAN